MIWASNACPASFGWTPSPLSYAGLSAETCATAEEFLRSPGRCRAGCLILDVHLPGLSGLELQKRLNDEGRNVPVVFITSYADDQERELALQSGAVAFLQKPFEERLLLEAVGRSLRRG